MWWRVSYDVCGGGGVRVSYNLCGGTQSESFVHVRTYVLKDGESIRTRATIPQMRSRSPSHSHFRILTPFP